MDPTADADPPPGCLVLLLDLSAAMARDVATARGEVPAAVAARFVADELLDGLVNTAAAGYAVGPLDVAVLGHRTSEDGVPQLLSLLPDGDPNPRLVPLAQLAELPAEPRGGDGQPRKWTVAPAPAGDPAPAAALARVYQMVAVWLTGRYASRPPVVVHCTGGDGLDEAYLRTARALGLLATACGPVRLAHYAFTPQPDGILPALAEVSCDVPGRRAAFVNEWDIAEPWYLVLSFAPQEEVAWAGGGPAFDASPPLWAAKMGNTAEQWEDAFAVDAAGGAAAVADGASTGIYCRTWARQLTDRFLADRPDARDPVALNKWVGGLRAEWRAALDYPNLGWSKQAKVDQVGAAATLLGLEFGPAGEAGRRPWRACAVGDACLFWVRGGRLWATFPVVAADQFGSAPLLVRSNPGFRTVALAAAGACEPEDRFVLATDAVAARLLKSVAAGPDLDWGRFERLAETEWHAELDALRSANDMVNDDCTLVVLRVLPASGGREPPEQPAAPEELAEPGPAVAHEEPAAGDADLNGVPEATAVEAAEVTDADAVGEIVDRERTRGADAPRSPEHPASDT